ncbi:MAG: sigma-70 family RNA polymerase sigma factor [Saccharospirillaceae bacterium]|nr:sigma-70 family RNA polymerase sigma factor [Pseudomonadales bacterium]NRB77489.1 sigma-70 family RNA polymerase sigma factor [Saccharospirillaceae bacterium]
MNENSNNNLDIEQLYIKYSGMVYRRCLKILQDESSAMDVMQDLFVKLLNKQNSIHSEALSSLLYQMATNLSLNLISKQKVRSDYVINNPAQSDDEIDSKSDIESHIIDESLLLKYLKHFDVRTCELAIYHYIDGYTLDEVAKMQQLSNSSVRRLLSQMKEKLNHLYKVGEVK